MNRVTSSIASLTATAAIFATGCENLTPGENAAVFGGITGIAAGSIARAAGASTGQSIAIGAAAGAIAAATAYIVAKHQATERQRRLAEQRARVYYARTVGRTGGRTASSKKATAKQRPRYIAVDTEKNKDTSPRAKKAVMIWDTKSESIVGNTVYDVEKTPSVGSNAKFDTYSAQYVGSGG